MSDKLESCPLCGSKKELDIPNGYVTKREMDQKVIDAVSAARKRWAKSDRVLDGYVLVPVLLTDQMINKIWDCDHMDVTGSPQILYTAMLSAATDINLKGCKIVPDDSVVELPTVLLPKDTDKITKV